MINPFMINNNYDILTYKALNIINNTLGYLSTIFGKIEFNLLFGRFKQYDDNSITDATVLHVPLNEDDINYRLANLYFEYIVDKNKPSMFIDLELLYYEYGDMFFEISVKETFLHEYRHVYQNVTGMYKLDDPEYEHVEYSKLPWEVDAFKFTNKYISKLPSIPFTILEEV